MAIAFDNATNGGNTPAISLTFAHTCSGVNRFLVVVVTDLNATTTGVKYNGVAMTLLNTQTGYGESFWYLVNPASGTNDVVVTKSAGAASVGAVAASYTGVNQTTPIDSQSATTNSTTASVSASTTVVASNCWVIGVTSENNDSNLNTVSGNLTQRVNQNWYASSNQLVALIYDSNATVSSGSNTVTSTKSSGINWVQVAAISIAPAPLSNTGAFFQFM